MRIASLIVLAVVAAGAQPSADREPPPIAFTSSRADHDLVVLRRDGSGRHILTASARDDTDPSWSPDGTRVAFSHYDGRRERVDVLDLRTGKVRNLGEGYNPDWSSDGTRLVFLEASNFDDLVTMDADGSNRRNLGLTAAGIADDTDPSWSPDGGLIAFVGDGLYTVRPDGTGLRRIRPEGHTGRATWSPGGQRIAFDCFTRRFAVCTTSRAGLGLRGVTNLGSGPAWSPGGGLIAISFGDPYTDDRAFLVRTNGRVVRKIRELRDPEWAPGNRLVGEQGIGETSRLYSTDAAGRALARLTDSGLRIWDSAPSWSPDGRSIAFRRYGRRGCALAVERVASRRVRVLFTRKRIGSCRGRADWSMDGGRLLFGSGGELWTVSSRGTRLRRLHVKGRDPRWAPDGKSITFVSGTGIWMKTPGRPKRLLLADGGPFAWSHDGTKLAYVSGDPFDEGSHLYVRTGAAAPRKLLDNVEDAPTWSADDRLIAATATPSEPGAVMALTITDLAGNAMQVFENGWQPDWRR